MIDRKLLDIKSRMQFYRDHYRRGVIQLISLLFLIAILIIVLFYEVLNQPAPSFYATTSAGELVLLEAMDAPNYSSSPLIK